MKPLFPETNELEPMAERISDLAVAYARLDARIVHLQAEVADLRAKLGVHMINEGDY